MIAQEFTKVEVTNKDNDIIKGPVSNDSTKTLVDSNRGQVSTVLISIRKDLRKQSLRTKMELSIHSIQIRKTLKMTLRIGGPNNSNKHNMSRPSTSNRDGSEESKANE